MHSYRETTRQQHKILARIMMNHNAHMKLRWFLLSKFPVNSTYRHRSEDEDTRTRNMIWNRLLFNLKTKHVISCISILYQQEIPIQILVMLLQCEILTVQTATFTLGSTSTRSIQEAARWVHRWFFFMKSIKPATTSISFDRPRHRRLIDHAIDSPTLVNISTNHCFGRFAGGGDFEVGSIARLPHIFLGRSAPALVIWAMTWDWRAKW